MIGNWADVVCVGLFVVLVVRIRENHLQNNGGQAGSASLGAGSDRVRSAESTVTGNGASTGGQVSGEESDPPTPYSSALKVAKALARPQNQESVLTLAIFALLVVLQVVPALLGSSVAPAQSTPSSSLHKEIVWVQLELLDASNNALHAKTDFLVGTIDASAEESAHHWGTWSAAFINSIASRKDLRGVAIVTHSGKGLYSLHHANIDRVIDTANENVPFYLHSVHGFEAEGSLPAVRSAISACFGNVLHACPRFLSEKSVNSHIMHQLQLAQRNCKIEHTERPLKVNEKSEPEPGLPQQNQQVIVDAGNNNQNLPGTLNAVQQPGSSFFKLVFVWLSRTLGFIVPFHQTYESLLHKEPKVGQWRAYWSIYAGVHMLEELFFIHLVYLMPLYLVGKMLLVGWCTLDDNAALLYNRLVQARVSLVKRLNYKKKEN